jgi:hypothetical protein
MNNALKYLTLNILLTVCFASSAQKSILINDIQPLLAVHSELQNEIVLSSEYTISGTRLYAEEKLGLEEWMLGRDNRENHPLFMALYKVPARSMEKDLFLEEWMLRPDSPEGLINWDFLRVDTEPALELQEWMIRKDL